MELQLHSSHFQTIQVEREAYKKLTNVKKDHMKRLTELEKVQQLDREKAELITRNQELVDHARLAIQTALANQVNLLCLSIFL